MDLALFLNSTLLGCGGSLIAFGVYATARKMLGPGRDFEHLRARQQEAERRARSLQQQADALLALTNPFASRSKANANRQYGIIPGGLAGTEPYFYSTPSVRECPSCGAPGNGGGTCAYCAMPYPRSQPKPPVRGAETVTLEGDGRVLAVYTYP